MSEGERTNQSMLKAEERSYETALLSLDKGMWTVYETVKRPIAKVASEGAANDLIRRLKIADRPQDHVR